MTFSFAHPELLFLLPIPAALLVWTWRRSSSPLVLPIDHTHAPPGRWLALLVGCAESLWPLLLAVAILIIAAPQRLGAPQVKRALTNIEFCVDVSGSMTASFGEGSRYDASMAAINEFLDYRTGDAFGLTFFGTNVLHWVPLTSDASAIRCSPPFMRPEMLPPWYGGTRIGKALMACRKVLESREEGDRMIILISDGYSFDLGGDNDQRITKRLTDANITVFAVHIGGGSVPDPIVNITALTGGEVFEAGDEAGLVNVFQRIDAMKPTRMEKTTPETMDNFRPFCFAGFALLGLGMCASFGLRYTPW